MEAERPQTQPMVQEAAVAATEQREGESQPGSNVIVIRLNKTYLVMALVAVVFYVGGYLTHSFLAGRITEVPQPAQPVVSNPTGLQAAGLVVDADDDPFLGPADAAVTIVEFSDYQCPFCKRFRDQTLDQILETYEGKVRYVYRDFPLSSIHPSAQKAAEAAECANEQGQFWPMHDRLFAQQPTWANTPDPGELFKRYATELDLDITRFNKCLDTGKYAGEVLADFDDGVGYGVTGTPTFFINGVSLAGAQPFSSFQTIIEAELAD